MDSGPKSMCYVEKFVEMGSTFPSLFVKSSADADRAHSEPWRRRPLCHSEACGPSPCSYRAATFAGCWATSMRDLRAWRGPPSLDGLLAIAGRSCRMLRCHADGDRPACCDARMRQFVVERRWTCSCSKCGACMALQRSRKV